MSRRRSEMLDEMGLSPRWRLRAGVAAPGAAQPGAASGSASVRAAASGGPVESPIAAAGDAPAGTTPRSVMADQLAEALRVSAPVSQPEDARHAAVMRMDWPRLEAAVTGCTACALSTTRKCTVFGVGDPRASWLFVGEGPGAEEDERGEPFVGRAGRLLDNMLAALKMKRGQDVYIANIVKCRPPGNRVPAAAEVSACEPYLHRQIELIQPKLIIALGKTAAVTLLGKEQSLAGMRGKVFRYRDTPLIVTYHPAYLLRTPVDKLKTWEDLCFARARVREWQARPDAGMVDAGADPVVPSDFAAAPPAN